MPPTINSNNSPTPPQPAPPPNGGWVNYPVVIQAQPAQPTQQVLNWIVPPVQWVSLTSDVVFTAVPAKKKELGCKCKRCEDFNEYAEPNQEDGTFICYGCRRGF